jgi:pimeloyl-ACP methyl ester carboxylesterase
LTTSASEYVTIAGCRLEYRRIDGPGRDAPTIVFLHEGLGSITQWRDFPAALCARSRCAGLVYNRRGYGSSDPVDRMPLTFMHCEALEILPRVLEHFAIEQPVLFGHSDGGSISLIHAGSGRAVTALIVEAPHVFVEERTVTSITALRQSYRTTGLRERLERHHAGNVDRLFDAWTETWLNNEFRAWNIEAFLPQVTCPCLVIQGREDAYGTLKQVESIMKARRAQAASLVLNRCGHRPHIDQRDLVLSASAAFIHQVLSPR